MATNFAYDDKAYARQRTFLGTTAVGTANTSGQFPVPCAAVLHGIRYASIIAGTGTPHTVILKNGTTGLSTTTLGTLAALSGTYVDLADVAVATGDVLSLLHGTDGTGVFASVLEWTPTGGTDLQN